MIFLGTLLCQDCTEGHSTATTATTNATFLGPAREWDDVMEAAIQYHLHTPVDLGSCHMSRVNFG